MLSSAVAKARLIHPLPESLSTTTVTQSFHTTATIAGPEESVKKAVESILKEFPPQGYGTEVIYTRWQGGKQVTVVTRSNSSD
jgi:predicted transcriptional regulator YdeE